MDENLFNYTTTKFDYKKGINRTPVDNVLVKKFIFYKKL